MGMEAIVEAAGEDSFILGCNAPMWPSIGVVHGMRITNDNSRSWKKFKHLARECFPRNWQNGHFWINDPDTVLLQNQMLDAADPAGNGNVAAGCVTENEFLFNAAYTMATGGMVLSSDDISALRDRNVELLRKLIPPVPHAAEFEDDSYTVGRAKLDDARVVVYMFNFTDCEQDICAGIDGKATVLDLFEDRDLGMFENQICIEKIPAHCAKVLICRHADQA
jgi:alpha-galactosidase